MLQKKISYDSLCIVIVLAIGYTIHSVVLSLYKISHSFNLLSIYLFQAIATLILCVTFEIIAQKLSYLKDQLGFLYLGAMALKVIVFCLVFNNIVFSSVALSKADSLSLLIPVFLFLLVEVVIIAKILNRKN